MTEDEFIAEFEKELYTQFNISKTLSPYKTGNLRENAIKILKTPTGYKIYVDMDIAPYAQWLDQYPKTQREHPIGWWNEICKDIIEKIMKKYK